MKTITFDETKWKLVPIELTREMLMAALDVGSASYDNHQYVLTAQWKDMLGAAPTAPYQEPAAPQGFTAEENPVMALSDCINVLESPQLLNDSVRVWACVQNAKAAMKSLASPSQHAVPMSESQRADIICAVAAICTGTSSRTVAATAIEWTERYYGIATAPSQEPGKCAQCKKPYRKGANTEGCPKCAPGVDVPESEFQKPISAPSQPVTLTDEQRQQVFRDAESRMMRDINLSWRNAVVDEVERAIAALREKEARK